MLHGGQFDISKKYIAPTVVKAELNAKCLQAEIFGPILPIITLDGVSQFLAKSEVLFAKYFH